MIDPNPRLVSHRDLTGHKLLKLVVQLLKAPSQMQQSSSSSSEIRLSQEVLVALQVYRSYSLLWTMMAARVSLFTNFKKLAAISKQESMTIMYHFSSNNSILIVMVLLTLMSSLWQSEVSLTISERLQLRRHSEKSIKIAVVFQILTISRMSTMPASTQMSSRVARLKLRFSWNSLKPLRCIITSSTSKIETQELLLMSSWNTIPIFQLVLIMMTILLL